MIEMALSIARRSNSATARLRSRLTMARSRKTDLSTSVNSHGGTSSFTQSILILSSSFNWEPFAIAASSMKGNGLMGTIEVCVTRGSGGPRGSHDARVRSAPFSNDSADKTALVGYDRLSARLWVNRWRSASEKHDSLLRQGLARTTAE